MGDPHHIPVLTPFDVLTVRLYRLGLATVPVGLVALAAEQLTGRSGLMGWGLVWLGVQLAVADIHLYDSRFRWVFTVLAQLGSLFGLLGAVLQVPLLWWAGLGFLFATHSGIGLKERLCFKVTGMRVQPAVLAASLVPLVAGWGLAAAGLLGLGALIAANLARVKGMQPLHYDIGDKSKYR